MFHALYTQALERLRISVQAVFARGKQEKLFAAHGQRNGVAKARQVALTFRSSQIHSLSRYKQYRSLSGGTYTRGLVRFQSGRNGRLSQKSVVLRLTAEDGESPRNQCCFVAVELKCRDLSLHRALASAQQIHRSSSMLLRPINAQVSKG